MLVSVLVIQLMVLLSRRNVLMAIISGMVTVLKRSSVWRAATGVTLTSHAQVCRRKASHILLIHSLLSSPCIMLIYLTIDVSLNASFKQFLFSEIVCPFPPTLPQTTRVLFGNVFLYQARVRYTCDTGTRTETGHPQTDAVCGVQGLWNGVDFTCKGGC